MGFVGLESSRLAGFTKFGLPKDEASLMLILIFIIIDFPPQFPYFEFFSRKLKLLVLLRRAGGLRPVIETS